MKDTGKMVKDKLNDRSTLSTDPDIVEQFENESFTNNLDNYNRVLNLVKRYENVMMGLYKSSKLVKFRNYLLFHRMPDGNIKIIEGVKAGIYKFKLGSKTGIHILGDNMDVWTFGTKKVMGWYCDARYVFPPPNNSQVDSQRLSELISTYETIERRNEAIKIEGWGKFALYIGFAILVIFFGYWFFTRGQAEQTIILLPNGSRLETMGLFALSMLKQTLKINDH